MTPQRTGTSAWVTQTIGIHVAVPFLVVVLFLLSLCHQAAGRGLDGTWQLVDTIRGGPGTYEDGLGDSKRSHTTRFVSANKVTAVQSSKFNSYSCELEWTELPSRLTINDTLKLEIAVRFLGGVQLPLGPSFSMNLWIGPKEAMPFFTEQYQSSAVYSMSNSLPPRISKPLSRTFSVPIHGPLNPQEMLGIAFYVSQDGVADVKQISLYKFLPPGATGGSTGTGSSSGNTPSEDDLIWAILLGAAGLLGAGVVIKALLGILAGAVGKGTAGSRVAGNQPGDSDLELTDATGKKHVYQKDPETGKYINILTGGELDPDQWERWNKDLVRDKEFNDQQREKQESGDTAQDRALNEMLQKQQAQRQEDQQRLKEARKAENEYLQRKREEALNEMDSWTATLSRTLENSQKEIEESIQWTADAVQTVEDVYNNPQKMKELKEFADEVYGDAEKSAKEAWQDVKDAAAETAKNPMIAVNTVLWTGQDVQSRVADHLTDPQKMKEFVKSASGYDNFKTAIDSDQSLGVRLASVGLGMLKINNLGGTLATGTKRAAGFYLAQSTAGYHVVSNAVETYHQVKSVYEPVSKAAQAMGIKGGGSVEIGTVRQAYQTIKKYGIPNL